ncbi:MAG: guanylate kinase, partial [Lachnospiraceae bacterium]|nr:guanylate kinase [Lachnospiraceae bacterium]
MLFFILPPSMEELRRRLEHRGTETPEQIQKRLDRAEEEKKFIDKYNYVIINEDVEKSVDLLHNNILAKNELK